MSKHNTRLCRISAWASLALLFSLAACSASDNPQAGASGATGLPTTGGSSGTATGGGSSHAGSTSAGGSPASGGSSGGAPANGGAGASAGAPSGGGASGATSGAGGTSAGGTSAGGGSAGGPAACPGASATEFNLVSSWLADTAVKGALPAYAYSDIKTNFPAGAAFDRLACTIAMSCVEFAPMETDWLRKCEAVLTSAIVAESSYNPKSVVTDSYATRTVGNVTANDPTVGLLQIRFSSTVHDYNYYASLPKMAAIGCAWPAGLSSQADTDTWWATNGGTATYLAFMQDPSCNIALASWYYFYNATGNGGANAVYISNYCSGHGIAGTMVDGLLSHLMGGGFPRPADANNAYPWGIECCAGGSPNDATCTGCTGRFAAFMGIGTMSARPSPDPFQEQLAPEVSKYCK